MEENRRIVSEWEGFIKNNDGQIETVTLHKYVPELPESFQPAIPANIVPNTHRPPNRPYRLLFCFSDAQIDYRRLPDNTLEPIHDERALNVVRLMCRSLLPDEIINLGDSVDLSVLSRFQPDSDHFYRTLGPSFQRIHDFYAELRADNPKAKIVEVDSNHNTRLRKFVGKWAMALSGIHRPDDKSKYPVLTYPYLANLEHLGVEWISGYAGAEYVYGENREVPIIFKHGEIVVSQGSTAARESKINPEVNVVRGHGHRMETQYRTNRYGQYLASVMVGALCKITGEVPSVKGSVNDEGYPVRRLENWQQGVLVIEDYSGHYVFNHVPIIDGLAYYRGKEYAVH